MKKSMLIIKPYNERNNYVSKGSGCKCNCNSSSGGCQVGK